MEYIFIVFLILEQKSGYRYRSLQTGEQRKSVKRELLNIEGGKIKKGNNVIFDDLSLELFQGEITGSYSMIFWNRSSLLICCLEMFYFIQERFL